MIVLILNEVQKDSLKGKYGNHSELNPIPLKNGNYFVPYDVLLNQEFTTIHPILKELPVMEITANDLMHYED